MSPKTCDEVRYISRYFYNMGIEGWNIAGWRESQNNIDILESQNSSYYSISLKFAHVLTSEKCITYHLQNQNSRKGVRGGVHSDHVSVGEADLAP